MIIDAHAHTWDRGWRPRWTEDGLEHTIAHHLGVSKAEAERMMNDSWDPNGDKLVAEMDQSGVDITVILRIDYGVVLPGAENDCRVPFEEQCRITARAVQKHPGRLIWGMGVDPRRSNYLELMDLCLGTLGAKRVKLYPPGGFYPNDRIVYPIYEKALQYGAPVDFHTMPTLAPPMRSKYSHPLHLEDVATDFPDLKIMATHSGGPFWWQDMLAIAEGKENIYLNVGGWQLELKRNPIEGYRKIREMMNRVGSKRMIWASDWTGFSAVPQGPWLKAFQEIPLQVREAGIEFTEKELQAFLGESAAAFQGIG
jgi:uncharacterized protein